MLKIQQILFLLIITIFITNIHALAQKNEIIINAHDLKKYLNYNEEYYDEEDFVLQRRNNREILHVNIGNIQSQDGTDVFSIDLKDINILPDSLTTFSWKWLIKDTDFSEGIFIRIYTQGNRIFDIVSHSNRTFPNTLICNDKSSVWSEHKINLFDLYDIPEKKPEYLNKKIIGLTIISLQAFNQDLSIEYFKFSSESLANVQRIKNLHFANQYNKNTLDKKPISGCLADIDRDGDLDLYLVNQVGSNYALLNDGNARFSDPTFLYDEPYWFKNSHANFFDLNNDGWLDLFEGRENTNNQLFINQGDCKFEQNYNYEKISNPYSQTYSSLAGNYIGDTSIDFIEIAATLYNENNPHYLFIVNNNMNLDFIPHHIGWGFALFGGCAADINDNSHLDFFTANNTGQNYLFTLDDSLHPHFYDTTIFQDQFFPENKKYRGFYPSEGAVFCDIDRDCDFDIYVSNDGKANQFYIQDQGKFVESADQYGLADSMASEGFLVADFDNDMDWDIYLLHTYQQNTLLLNDGSGNFYDGTEGSGFEYSGGSIGAACGDVDNDGDVDVILVDPGRGHRLLLNPLNNNNFIKINIRGEPGNYYGLRSKIYIYGKNDTEDILKLYHQTTCGDGFQYEAFPRDFHFGLIPGKDYRVKVIFSDGKEISSVISEPGQSITAIYPESNFIYQAWNSWLYNIHEPFLIWLRIYGKLISVILLIVFSLVINFAKIFFIRNINYRFLIGIIGLLVIYLFLRDLKIINTVGIVSIAAVCLFFSEAVLNSLRKFLRKHYVQETSWDRLFDHLQAFRHGGIALKNMDRLIFLYQNFKSFEGEIKQYQRHINDAIQTYLNQTSWQLTELVYILKNLRWDRNDIFWIASSNKQLLRRFKRILSVQSKPGLNEKSIQQIIEWFTRIQKTVSKIYRQILHHFVCNPTIIIREVINTKFGDASIKLNNNITMHIQILIKGYELGNIISDLIENGIRACVKPNNFSGQITLSEDDQKICIDVKDNGCGIPKTEKEKIFEKGFSKTQSGGGFGLFYSKEITKRYGGEIFIHATEKNKGTTMRLKLKKVKLEV